MNARGAALFALIITSLSASSAFACGMSAEATVLLASVGLLVVLTPYVLANGIALAVMGPEFLQTNWWGILRKALVSAVPAGMGLVAGAGLTIANTDLGLLDMSSTAEAALVLTTPAVFSTAYLSFVWSRARRLQTEDEHTEDI